jgi:hypothetical protein
VPRGCSCVDNVLCFVLSQSRAHFVAALLAICGALACITQVSAESAQSGPINGSPTVDHFTFAISAQSLEDALMVYAKETGVEVFVDHTLVVGRRSGPVQGRYGSEEALKRLIAGTGLEIRRAAPQAYTLVATTIREPPSTATPDWAVDRARSQFFAAVQLAIKRILCEQPQTMPGSYRAALTIRTDPAGRVVDAHLLDSSTDVEAGRQLLDRIQGAQIGQAPPADLEQPVTFVILPRRPDQTGDCALRKAGDR